MATAFAAVRLRRPQPHAHTERLGQPPPHRQIDHARPEVLAERAVLVLDHKGLEFGEALRLCRARQRRKLPREHVLLLLVALLPGHGLLLLKQEFN